MMILDENQHFWPAPIAILLGHQNGHIKKTVIHKGFLHFFFDGQKKPRHGI
jgi:hypothetical protein